MGAEVDLKENNAFERTENILIYKRKFVKNKLFFKKSNKIKVTITKSHNIHLLNELNIDTVYEWLK